MPQLAKQVLDQVRKGFKEIYDGIPTLVGGKAVTFFQDNFRRQGWVYNGSLKKWVPRKAGAARNQGRAILMDSGQLIRSIRVASIGKGFVLVGSDVPYAKIHNEGGVIDKNVSVRAYTRKKYQTDEVSAPAAKKAKYQKTHTGDVNVKAHTRHMHVVIPQRQFMGESPDVIKSAERDVVRRIEDLMVKANK